MTPKYRIREHILVNHRGKDHLELLRGMFPPGPLHSTVSNHLQKVNLRIESEREAMLIEELLSNNAKSIDELSEGSQLISDKVVDIILSLEKMDLIETIEGPFNLSERDLIRYHRQYKLFSIVGPAYQIQERLKQAKVVIVGLGSIGCWLSYNLASMGIGNIIGFDHDKVELSNLNRQILFTEDDIGKPKALAAQEKLEKYNRDIQIKMYQMAIKKDNFDGFIPTDANVIVSTVVPTEYYLNKFCVMHDIPLLAQGGGNYCPSGVVLMRPHQTGCFDCIESPLPLFNDLLVKIHARHGKDYTPTIAFSPILSLCANIMAIEIFKLITGVGQPIDNVIIEPFTWEIRWNVFNLKPRGNCPTCGCNG